ncbi:MAG: O-antigen ligase family protein [Anaerolineae bacterium]|jgi:hypothetical protein|nr:O-antigen ligase family protein [Anaerolineae bacterium]
MASEPLFKLTLPRRTWIALAIAWLAVSAAVAGVVGIPYGMFLAWAGIATAVFVVNPFAGTLGLVFLNVMAADWGRAFVLFQDKPYNINQAGLANLVITALSALYIIRRRPRLAPLTLPFAAFLAAGLISIPFSSSPFAGLRDWTRMLPLAGLYVVAADLFREAPSRARVWVGALVASGVWPAIVSIYQGLTYRGYHNVIAGPGQNRMLGTLSHPIAYGVYLGIIVALTIYLFRISERGKTRALLGFWVIASLALLFFSYSRGPALAMFGSLIVLALVARRETAGVRAGLVGMAVVFLVVVLLAGRIQDLLTPFLYRTVEPVPAGQVKPPRPTPTPPLAGTPQAGPTVPSPRPAPALNSISWRLSLWRFAATLAMERPLVGLGLGGFPVQSPRLVGSAVTPHNDFVRVCAEMGLLGLGAFVWLWGALARRLFGFWRCASDLPVSLLAAAFLAMAAGYLVNSLSADLLNNPTVGWVFWPLMALPEAFAAKTGTQP